MKKLLPIFLIGFFFSAHLSLLAYINSTMLSFFVEDKWVSIIFIISSALSLALVFVIPKLIKKMGNSRFTTITLTLSIILLFLIGNYSNINLIIPIFILYYAFTNIISYSIDIFIEHYSKKGVIGNIRGLYLTLTSLGWVIMPFISGILTTDYSYKIVYIIASLLLIITIFILVISQRNFKDSIYHDYNGSEIFKELKNMPEIRRIITLNFLLQFYFSWMVIYLPLYLKTFIGFNNFQLGTIFSIMLLPFVLFEYPAGKIADKIKNGEKIIIIIGLITMGFSTILFSLITIKSLLIYSSILFITRIGASIFQVSNDSYFFKRIDDKQTGLIGLDRKSVV